MGVMTKILQHQNRFVDSITDHSITRQKIDMQTQKINDVSANIKHVKTQLVKQQNSQPNVHNALTTKYNKLLCKYTQLMSIKQQWQNWMQQNDHTYYVQTYKDKLNQYKICSNRHYHSLEGNQAKKYRLNFADIGAHLHPSTFYIHINKVMNLYNKLMSIIGSNRSFIEEPDIEKARKILEEFDKQWKYSAVILNVPISLGTKYHYLHHAIEFMEIWRIPIGYVSEQSIESFHKTCSMVFRRYVNQRGTLRIKYAIRQLFLITSPVYQNMDNN